MIPGARDLFVLDPSVAYLNHGAFGAVPTVVREARQRLLDEYDRNPLRFVTGDLHARTVAARTELTTFLGIEPDLSALVGNVTQGVSIVLNTLDLREGDEILLTDHSYNAVTLAAHDQLARRGVKVAVAPIDLGRSGAEPIVEHLTNRTRLVIVDQVSSATAQRHPVDEIAAALRRRGVPLLIDGAHVPGMLPRPLAGVDADFWVGNLHKWAFAPAGTALLRVAPAWADRIVPLAVSHNHLDGYPDRVEHQGTRDFTTWLAAPTGLSLFARFGEAEIQRHNEELAALGQRIVGAALNVDPADLPDPGAGVSMRIIPLPAGIGAEPAAASALRQRIGAELGIELAVTSWRGRGWIRICAQMYNSVDDYERLAAGLPALLDAVK